MPDTVLAGDFTVFYSTDGNRQAIKWTGAATGTRTVNELYSALQDLFDDPSQMDDLVPIRADTPDIYRIINQWFIDDETVEHLKGGSIFSDKWIDGTTEHILTIGYSPTTEFNEADIGRTIAGGTTGDTGTILDFNTQRNLLWIRPDDPASGGDEFDNGTESYTIQNDPIDQVWQVDVTGPTFVDETADANSVTNADWQIFPGTEEVGDYVAIGFARKFSKLIFDNLNGTAGAGGAVTWEYWDGTAWTALAGVVDGTSGFTAAAADGQALTFTVPSDWATRALNASAELYYIRAVISTTYTTNPVYDQGFVGGVGAGSFASHTRHGSASVAGESAWVGVLTEILGSGAFPQAPHVAIYREGPDQVAGSFVESKVVSTKGTSDWWGDGDIDILLKVKEAGSLFGERPNATAQTVATFTVRQYTNKYGFSLKNNLPTAGGNVAPAIAVDTDLDNTTGYRTNTLSSSSGTWKVGDRLENATQAVGETKAVITEVADANPSITLRYYLVGDPLLDFVSGDTINNLDDTGTGTSGTPADHGPALDTTVTVVSGATTEDINNGNGARPYSVRIDPAGLAIERVYERLKYITRRGSTVSIAGQDGEQFLGAELQIEYSAQSGAFVEGEEVFDTTTKARGIIIADHDDGATGDVILRTVRGSFTAGNVLGDAASAPTDSATIDSVRQVSPVTASPLGTFAGGTFFGAPGITLTTANLAAGDEQAYQLIDDNGSTQIPPNTVAVEVTNLVSGDTVAVFRRTGAAIDKTDFTTAGGANNQGDFALDVNASPSTEYPPSGKVRVISKSGQEHRYRYTSISAAQFVLANKYDGFVADAGGSATVLIDAAATFSTDGVEEGDLVFNVTQGEFVKVVSVDSETQLTTEALSSGIWDGDTYDINSLVETYADGLDVYVPFIDTVAASASVSNTMVHSVDVDIKVVVRNAGVILPFEQDTTIVSTGRSTATIRNADDIFTA